jgi:hypothetical protein
MPNRYYKSGATIWNSANSWSATGPAALDNAGIPSAADDVIFEAGSGLACAVTTTIGVCNNFTTTGYTGTITLNVDLNVFGPSIFVANTTFDPLGAGWFTIGNTTVVGIRNMTSNGVVFPKFQLGATGAGANTINFLDVLNVGSIRTASFTNGIITNGSSVNVNVDMVFASATVGFFQGTTVYNLIGTGNFGSSGATPSYRCPININTAGTITFLSNVLIFNSTFTYIAGNVITAGNTTTFNGTNTVKTKNTISGNEISFNNVNSGISGAATTTTLQSDMRVLGNFATAANNGYNFDGFTIFVAGNINNANAPTSGTTVMEMYGSVSATISGGQHQRNLIINKTGGATVTVILNGLLALSWGAAGRTLNIITGNNLILSAALSALGGTVLVPTGGIISGPSNLIMAGTSTLDVATGITIPNLATANTITVTLSRTTVATNYSGISTGVTFTAASAGTELRVNNIIAHSGTTTMGTNTIIRLMGGTFVTFTFLGSCVLNTGATITGTGVGGSGFVVNGTASLNLSAGTLVLPAVSGSYRTGTGITQSQGPLTLNMGTNEIDYFTASSGGLGNGRLILASDLKINKVFYGNLYGTGVTDNGFNIIVKESIFWKNGGFVSTGKIIYKGVPSGTGFVGTGYISGTTLTLLSVTSGTLIPGQYIHCPSVSTAAPNLINTVTTFGNTYTVATSQTVGSAGSPVVFYGDGANADLGSPYSSPASTRGILEIDAGSNKVYYFGGQFNTALSEFRYLSSNTGDFDGSKAVVSPIVSGNIGTIDFQGQSSPTKYIGTMLIGNFFGAFILKSDLYVNDHQGNLGLSTYLQNSGGSYSLYVMRNFSVGNGTAVPYVQQPTIRLVGPLSCTFTSSNFMGNLVIAKDAGAVVTVTQSFVYGYATPTTITYTSGIVNFGATTLSLTGSVSIINPSSPGNFSFNNVSTSAGIGVTITNPMTITGTLALGGTTTFAGTAGWTCGTLTCSQAGSTITLREAVTYTTRNSVTMLGTDASRILMRTSDTIAPIVLAKWTLENTPAAQSMTYVSATAIDSSAGMTIYSYQGGTNGIDALTINWRSESQPVTKSFTFVC